MAAGEGTVRAPLTSRTRNLCAARRPSPPPRFVSALALSSSRDALAVLARTIAWRAPATPPRAGAAAYRSRERARAVLGTLL